MDERFTILDVLDEVQNWLETEYPNDMSPSEYREAMQKLDDLGMMDFEEMLVEHQSLSSRFYDDFAFDIFDKEFEEKLDNMIKSHITYLEETCSSYGYDEEW